MILAFSQSVLNIELSIVRIKSTYLLNLNRNLLLMSLKTVSKNSNQNSDSIIGNNSKKFIID